LYFVEEYYEKKQEKSNIKNEEKAFDDSYKELGESMVFYHDCTVKKLNIINNQIELIENLDEIELCRLIDENEKLKEKFELQFYTNLLVCAVSCCAVVVLIIKVIKTKGAKNNGSNY